MRNYVNVYSKAILNLIQKRTFANILSKRRRCKILQGNCITGGFKCIHYATQNNLFRLIAIMDGRVSVQGVKSLGGHFACLCREFDFYEVKIKYYYFSKRNWK